MEYTVYETAVTTRDPIKGMRVAHPVAHYDNYSLMIEHWFGEFVDGTHLFIKSLKEVEAV